MSDQYQVDIGSVKALIHAWQTGSDEVSGISKQLSDIHEQLKSCVPSVMFEGPPREVPLAESLAKIADAASAAQQVAQGLAQDTASLDANLAAYVATEASIEAKLKSIRKHHDGHAPPRAGGG